MRYPTITATALLALSGSLVAAGCISSTATPSSSTSPTPTAPTVVASSTSSSSGGVALPAADCAVIKPLAASAIATLAPMQTESSSAAAAALSAFIGQLNQAASQLTSAQAKADLGAFVSALSQATSNSTTSQNAIVSALQKLSTDCPS